MLSLQQVLEMVLGMGIKDKHLWEHSKLVWSDLLRGEESQLLRSGAGGIRWLLPFSVVLFCPPPQLNPETPRARKVVCICSSTLLTILRPCMYTDCCTSVVFPVWSAVIHS